MSGLAWRAPRPPQLPTHPHTQIPTRTHSGASDATADSELGLETINRKFYLAIPPTTTSRKRAAASRHSTCASRRRQDPLVTPASTQSRSRGPGKRHRRASLPTCHSFISDSRTFTRTELGGCQGPLRLAAHEAPAAVLEYSDGSGPLIEPQYQERRYRSCGAAPSPPLEMDLLLELP